MKRTIITLIQATVTFGLLWYIFRDPKNNAAMWEAIRESYLGWLVLGVASIGVAALIQAQRWHLLLEAQGIALGWLRTLRIYMIGFFFNLFLLGSTGGDVVKIYYAIRESSTRKSAAFLSVVVDRMMGMLALAAIAAFVIVLRWNVFMAHEVTRALLGAFAVVLGAMLSAVVAGFLVDRLGLADKLPHWLPLRKAITDFAKAFSIYARNGRVLVKTFALSLLCHVFNFSAFYCAARALEVFTGWQGLLDICSIIPIVMTLTALPISLSGVGVREKLFVVLCGIMFLVPEAKAVPISLLGFAPTIFWAVVGGVVYFFYRPQGGLRLDV